MTFNEDKCEKLQFGDEKMFEKALSEVQEEKDLEVIIRNYMKSF